MAGESLISIAIVFRCHRGRRTFPGRSHAEKLTAMLQLFLPMGISEEAVIADAVESARENVQEEAADELVGRESHGFLLIVVAIVSPGEFYLTIFDIDDPMIGDGDPVGVATNVVHHLLWSGEGRLGVHGPIDVSHRIQMAVEAVEDFRRELAEIQSPEARRLFVLAKANHLSHMRTAEYVALVAAADVSGNHGVGVLLESCLGDHLAFVERTKRLIRHVIEAKIAARATG